MKMVIRVLCICLATAAWSFAGIAAHWSFDSTSQGDFVDISGNGHSARSTISVTDGYQGKALDCKDTFQVVIDSSYKHFNFDQVTVETWVYPTGDLVLPASFDNYHQLFDFVSVGTATYGGYGIYITHTGQFEMSVGTPGRWEVATSSEVLETHRWYHLVGSFDGQSIKIYINGQLAASSDFQGPYKPSQYDARIGHQKLTDGRMRNFFQGKIDEVVLHDVALSEEEVLQRYQGTVTEKKIVAQWSFDTVGTGIYYDVSGNGFHAYGDSLSVTDGVKGNALECKNDSFELVVQNSADGFNVDHFTVDAWIYSHIDLVDVPSFYNYKQIFNFVTVGPSTYGGYAIYITADGTLESGIGTETKWIYAISPKDLILKPKVWYHIATTYDGSTLKLFLDGQLIASQAHAYGYKKIDFDARIGSQRMTTGEMRNWFDGKIDELTLRNYAMTDAEIHNRYISLKPQSEPQFKINFGMKTTYASAGDTLWVPVYLTNYENFQISACQFNIDIDTAKLELLDISRDSGLVREWELFDYNGVGEGKYAVALGGSMTPVEYGEGEIVRCKFAIKPEVENEDTCLIDLSDINIDESNMLVTATCKPGRIIISNPDILYGDVTGNQVVNIFDARDILSYVVGSLELPHESSPNFTTEVADVSGNGTVTSYDAALVFQHSVGLLPEFPVSENNPLHKRAASNSSSQAANLSVALTKQSPSEGTVYTIWGSNLKGLVAGEFAIRYDPSLVSISNSDLDVPLRGVSVVTEPDTVNSLLKVAFTTNDYIDNNSLVPLVNLALPPIQSDDPLSAIELITALINEGKIVTNITPSGLSSPVCDNGWKPVSAKNRAVISGNNLAVQVSSPCPVDIAIWTLKGRRVLSRNFRATAKGSSRIGLSHFAPGLYLYRVQAGAEKFTGRFTVNR
ncbi:MAG: LamG-like jellyroll fold domain-containing protein [Fibrobacterota bacterium]